VTTRVWIAIALLAFCICTNIAVAQTLTPLAYNHPGLIVDLGVGLYAYPIPTDVDHDGDLDLLISCPDVPYNGTYFFENITGKVAHPTFRLKKRISAGKLDVTPSLVNGKLRVLGPGVEYQDFLTAGVDNPAKLPIPTDFHKGRVRGNQWSYVDFEGDGDHDLIAGVGDWQDYGWDNAYDENGKWKNGPLHGYVYLMRNEGDDASPKYAPATKIEAAGKPIDCFGGCSPNFADFDGDGDLDLICGEFLDGFTYFENTGKRTNPTYSGGSRLAHDREELAMHVQMIIPVAVDWDGDGDIDLVVGDEDGRVALVENTGKLVDGAPDFLPPFYFQQEAADLKFGALVTPFGADWDDDGDFDLVCGNTSGNIGWFENLSGKGVSPPKWAAPKLLETSEGPIRIMAGPNGSIQGPCEAKWGYTTQSVADWDGDGLKDLVVNSIWGKVIWFKNIGVKGAPKLAAAEPILFHYEKEAKKPAWNWWNPVSNQLVTQWRTTPIAVDWDRDDLCDLVMLDHEGFLCFFQRTEKGIDRPLLQGRRIFIGSDDNGQFDHNGKPQPGKPGPLQLNVGVAGKSGRRKLALVDWDNDGDLDLLANSASCDLFLNEGGDSSRILLRRIGPFSDQKLAGHDTAPATADFNANGAPDLILGAEDGRLYHLPR
jgi:hypothetical protein